MDQWRYTPALPQSPPFLARCAVSTIFFINGMVLASWVPHIPAVKAQHAISDSQLGIVLLSMAVGSVLALPLAGWLSGRFGSRRTTVIAALGFCLVLPLPIISPNIVLLAFSLMLLGACNGMLDVSMNAQAVEVERHYQRSIMSSFHGLFSLGGLIGAGVAGLAMSFSVGDVQHVATITILSVLAVLSASPESTSCAFASCPTSHSPSQASRPTICAAATQSDPPPSPGFAVARSAGPNSPWRYTPGSEQ